MKLPRTLFVVAVLLAFFSGSASAQQPTTECDESLHIGSNPPKANHDYDNDTDEHSCHGVITGSTPDQGICYVNEETPGAYGQVDCDQFPGSGLRFCTAVFNCGDGTHVDNGILACQENAKAGVLAEFEGGGGATWSFAGSLSVTGP